MLKSLLIYKGTKNKNSDNFFLKQKHNNVHFV